MILALKQKQLKQQSRSSAGIKKGTDYNIHMEEDGLLAGWKWSVAADVDGCEVW